MYPSVIVSACGHSRRVNANMVMLGALFGGRPASGRLHRTLPVTPAYSRPGSNPFFR